MFQGDFRLNLGAAFFIFGGTVETKELKASFANSYSVQEAEVLNEKERRVRITIIRVGPGNRNTKLFYAQEAIDTGAEVFEGATLGFNHPSKIDQQVHPEGDIEDIGGWLENVAPEGEQLKADAVVLPGSDYDWFWTLIKSSIEFAKRFPGRNLMGVSINAPVGVEGSVDIDGEKWEKVTKFLGVRRLDAVTTPAAGGMFEKIISESRKNIEIFKNRLTGFEKIVGAMESKGDEPQTESKPKAQAAPTDAPTIYAALMQKVRNLETSGAPGVDEVRRQLDELGTALKFNGKMEDDMVPYPGQDPTAQPGAGDQAGDMGEEALSPKDHAMAAGFHKAMAAQCQSESEAGKGNPGMLAHHTKMAAFHAAKASEGDVNIVAKPKPEPTGDAGAVPTEAEAKAKEEAEAKAKKEAESKGKESDPNFYGPAGVSLLKESEMTKAGLTDKQKDFIRVSLESESDPVKIKKTVTAYAAIWATEAGGGHNFQRREKTESSKKSTLVGALRDSGVLGEE